MVVTLTKLSQRDHTNAVAEVLENAGLTVGRGIRNTEPDGSGDTLEPPCVIVHPLMGGSRYGTLDDWTVHADLIYQLTCVGATMAQAEWVRDQTEVLLDGVAAAGRLIDVIRVDFGSDNAVRDDSIIGDKLFAATPRYRLYSTTA